MTSYVVKLLLLSEASVLKFSLNFLSLGHMYEIKEIVALIDQLMGPKGCPWDQKQTMKSIRADIIEEAAELVEAIDSEESLDIQEEMGDLLFVALFATRLAEKEKKGTLHQAAAGIKEKLIRRHPHVFGEAKCHSSEEVLLQWESIKAKEKSHRKSPFEGIPKSLPALSRAFEYHKKIKKTSFPLQKIQDIENLFTDEGSLGRVLMAIAFKAEELGLDAEHALRATLSSLEKDFLNKNYKV